MFPSHRIPYRWRRLASVGGALVLLIFVLHSSPQPKQKPPRLVWPKSETILNHNVYWELPSKDPSGILLFAHGCNHAGSDMWPNDSKTCPSCLGLPEEQRIREIFLRRNWAVVAISSLAATQNGAGCWDISPEIPGQDDLTSVPEIMKIITKREQKLKQLPIYALGASSGGGFVLLLPRTMHLKGIIAQIMAIPPQELEQAQQGKGGFSHPPTVFMHMPRDTRIAPVVADDVAVLQSRGIPAMEVKVDPQAVTPEFLYEHSQGGIGYEMAVGIVGALRNGKFINEEGMLLEDPRRTHDKWMAAVEVITEGQISLKPDASPLTELMNVAWAGHEIISNGVESALTWLESGGKMDLNRLLAAEKEAAAKKGR